MKIYNEDIYGLENAFRVCKFPKAVDTIKCKANYTDTIKKLGSAERGSGHDSFLQFIIVQFDLTCTIKMWVELERYHFISLDSQSTMHKIADMDLRLGNCEYVTDSIIWEIEKLQRNYRESKRDEDYLRLLYNIPVGFELTAGVSTNYQQLKTIYHQRKNHRLPEWREFCKWIEGLAYMDDFLKLEDA